MGRHMPRVVIGSRGSTLALVQSGSVREALQKRFPQLRVSVVPIRTQADREIDRSLDSFPEQGIFVKEIQEALLEGKIDLAVHSLKDLPSILPPGLQLVSTPRREDPRDCLVTVRPVKMEDLPRGARIGTGSPRRAVQILALRPDLRILPVRGNLGTRLRKLREGDFEALILAMAGLNRLGIKEYGILPFEPEQFLPAPGQGALGVEIRSDDSNLEKCVATLNHSPSSRTVKAERAFLATLGGGCRAPIGALATLRARGKIRIRGMVASQDGKKILSLQLEEKGAPESIGERLAQRFLDRGASQILDRKSGSG